MRSRSKENMATKKKVKKSNKRRKSRFAVNKKQTPKQFMKKMFG